MALSAALLHVLSGLVVFMVLRLIVGQVPSISGRGSPAFAMLGYGLVMLAGTIMLYQSLRPGHGHDHDGSHALTTGVGILPCPLTISVLGFAWTQSSMAMVGLVLVSLALGISLTIGLVAVLAILGRRSLSSAIVSNLPQLSRWSRVVQGAAGALIVAAGIVVIVQLNV